MLDHARLGDQGKRGRVRRCVWRLSAVVESRGRGCGFVGRVEKMTGVSVSTHDHGFSGRTSGVHPYCRVSRDKAVELAGQMVLLSCLPDKRKHVLQRGP